MSLNNTEKQVNIKNIKWIVMKKSTWTPNIKDHWEIESLKEWIDIKVDSYTFVDESKNEYKLTTKADSKNLNFWDSGTLKIMFVKD